MARKRPKVDLTSPVPPRSGDLDNLFSARDDVEQASGLQLLAIRIDAVHADPDQPRNTFHHDSLEELSSSIEQDGLIQPIEVTEVRPGNYMIVHGERRWRAARMAGLATIPAVVRRRDYDQVTRFVRQIVENIQREDLNDIDRAAGLVRLKDLLQEELTQAQLESVTSDKPWARKITWAKVGERLGYSRQRIHQLIKLLDLPEEIKEAVRSGELSERDTRVYQRLKASQQRALHRARMAGDVSAKEMAQIARFLQGSPEQTVHGAIRQLRSLEQRNEPPFETSPDSTTRGEVLPDPKLSGRDRATLKSTEILPTVGIERLHRVLSHLQRLQHAEMTREEMVQAAVLLRQIENHVQSLLEAFDSS